MRNTVPSKLKTAIEYTKNLLTTGAVSETSPKTEDEISSKVNVHSKVVIELGMGHGNITKKILSRLPQDAKLYAFEINEKFCEVVKATIKDERLVVVNASAENIRNHVPDEVDNIISSLPLTLFSKELKHKVLSDAANLLNEGGVYSQILYNKHQTKRFSKYFNTVKTEKIVAFPLQFIYHCS